MIITIVFIRLFFLFIIIIIITIIIIIIIIISFLFFFLLSDNWLLLDLSSVIDNLFIYLFFFVAINWFKSFSLWFFFLSFCRLFFLQKDCLFVCLLVRLSIRLCLSPKEEKKSLAWCEKIFIGNNCLMTNNLKFESFFLY